jgi:hypothetical protein
VSTSPRNAGIREPTRKGVVYILAAWLESTQQATTGLSELRPCPIVSDHRKMVCAAHVGRKTPSFGHNCEISPTRGGFRRSVPIHLAAPGPQTSGIKPHLPAHREEGLTVRKRRGRRRAVGVGGPFLVANPSRTLVSRWISSTTSLPAPAAPHPEHRL